MHKREGTIREAVALASLIIVIVAVSGGTGILDPRLSEAKAQVAYFKSGGFKECRALLVLDR